MRWFEGPPLARGTVAALVLAGVLAGLLAGLALGGRGSARAVVTVAGACPAGFSLVGREPSQSTRVEGMERPASVPGAAVCIED